MVKRTLLAFWFATVISAANCRNETEKLDYFYFQMANGTITRVDLNKAPVKATPQFMDFLKGPTCYLYNSYLGKDNPVCLYLDSCPVGYDPYQPTIVLCHGWTDSFLGPCLQVIKNAFVRKTKNNIILCDCPCMRTEYVLATNLLRGTGGDIANHMKHLRDRCGGLRDIQCYGHSLGGHSCGMMCKCMENKCSHICGMDVAAPVISLYDIENRLHWSHCHHLSCFHASCDVLGIKDEWGDFDCYMNCGKGQYGCDGKTWMEDMTGSCDHSKVCEFIAHLILYPQCFSTSLKCPHGDAARSDQCPKSSTTINLGDVIYRPHYGCWNIRTHDCYNACPFIEFK